MTQPAIADLIPAIADLIKERRPGHGLPQAFYQDPAVFRHDLGRIFLASWQYAGHVSQVPNVGDFFLFNLADESVIITRGGEAKIHALVNVCRHRGSRVCLENTGSASRLVCSYHGWTYALDGALIGAAQMPEGFDKARYGLKSLEVRVMAGLIFVCFADNPPPFATIEGDMAHCLAPYELDKAKVAHSFDYPIAANWKLAVENYCECYHCRPSHPEYSRGHALATPESQWEKTEADVNAACADIGLSDDVFDRTWLDAGMFGTEREHERYPLVRGHVTGSQDGQPVAPLLGNVREFVGAATDIQIGPTLFGLAYCDHLVLYRFTPQSIDQTLCQVTWLVRGDAVEGKDYHVEDLTWLWDVTTLADQRIIERNAQGVRSRFFEPGPFSEMETFACRFVDWYLAAIGGVSGPYYG